MRTTVNLEINAYRLARAVATQRHQGVGKVLGDALLSQFGAKDDLAEEVTADEYGFPTVRFGRSFTPDDVATAIEE